VEEVKDVTWDRYADVALLSSKRETEEFIRELAEEIMAWKFNVVPVYSVDAYRIATKNVLVYADHLGKEHLVKMEDHLGMTYNSFMKEGE
jgi:hypothetical protein